MAKTLHSLHYAYHQKQTWERGEEKKVINEEKEITLQFVAGTKKWGWGGRALRVGEARLAPPLFIPDLKPMQVRSKTDSDITEHSQRSLHSQNVELQCCV